MICGRCKSKALDGKRFCPKCGNDLLPSPDIDPLAATALANPKELQAIRDAAVEKSVKAPGKRPTTSPRTVPMARASAPGPAPKPSRAPSEIPMIALPPAQITTPMSALPSSSNPRAARPAVPAAAVPAPSAAPTPLAKGAAVFVRWADGNQYPGVVEQIADVRALVLFPNGQRQWIALTFLSAAPR